MLVSNCTFDRGSLSPSVIAMRSSLQVRWDPQKPRAPSDVLQLDLFREPQVFENQHFVLTVARSHKSTLQGTLKMKQAILTGETAAPEDFLVCSISALVGAGSCTSTLATLEPERNLGLSS
jgi:hypothetical protein